jgi:hypothetical protein
MKITVQNKVVKKEGQSNGKPWTVWEYTAETDRSDSEKLDSFDDLEVGKEYEGEIVKPSNPAYNDSFKLNKPKGGFKTKNYDFEKKRVALECAVSLVAAGKYGAENLTNIRDRFFEYLNS